MYLCSGILVALLFIIVVFVGEQGPVGGQEVGSEFEPLNATVQKGDIQLFNVSNAFIQTMSTEDAHSEVVFYVNFKFCDMET
jgi:hypothetical protein